MVRKITYKLYPTKKQELILVDWLRLHSKLYNAALRQRITEYKADKKPVSYQQQQNQLPKFKKLNNEFIPLGSHALQETLRKLDRAFKSFYQRVKAGQRKPGFPRFKADNRFKSFTYPCHAGWKLITEKKNHAVIKISKLGYIKARGKHRFDSIIPKTLTILKKNGCWYASVSVETDASRELVDYKQNGFDIGNKTLITFSDGETVDNPRFLRKQLQKIKTLQNQLKRKKKFSNNWKKIQKQVATVHEKVASQRKDYLHKVTTKMAESHSLLSTEKLNVESMLRKGKSKQKKGLNREILSASYNMIMRMLEYKVEETGTELVIMDTRKLKPTQRCSGCGNVEKKTLAVREHQCQSCGVEIDRDINSAVVCLKEALGTNAMWRGDPLGDTYVLSKITSMKHETPTKINCNAII